MRSTNVVSGLPTTKYKSRLEAHYSTCDARANATFKKENLIDSHARDAQAGRRPMLDVYTIFWTEHQV